MTTQEIKPVKIPVYVDGVLAGSFLRNAEGHCSVQWPASTTTSSVNFLKLFAIVAKDHIDPDGIMPPWDKMEEEMSMLAVPMWLVARHTGAPFGVHAMPDAVIAAFLELPTLIVQKRRATLAEGKPIKFPALTYGGGDC